MRSAKQRVAGKITGNPATDLALLRLASVLADIAETTTHEKEEDSDA